MQSLGVDKPLSLLAAAACGACIAYLSFREGRKFIQAQVDRAVKEGAPASDMTVAPRSRRGFSMGELQGEMNLEVAEAAHRTPQEVLSDLQRGNTRYCMGQLEHHHQQDISNKQHKRHWPSQQTICASVIRARQHSYRLCSLPYTLYSRTILPSGVFY